MSPYTLNKKPVALAVSVLFTTPHEIVSNKVIIQTQAAPETCEVNVPNSYKFL